MADNNELDAYSINACIHCCVDVIVFTMYKLLRDSSFVGLGWSRMRVSVLRLVCLSISGTRHMPFFVSHQPVSNALSEMTNFVVLAL